MDTWIEHFLAVVAEFLHFHILFWNKTLTTIF